MILATTEQTEISRNEQEQLIELSEKTTLDERQKKYLSLRIYQIETQEEYEEIERYLFLNIIEDKDRIVMGFNYGMNDIKKALKLL